MPGSNGNSTLTSVFGQGQFNSGSSGSNIPLSSGSSGSSFFGRVGGFFKDFGTPIGEIGAALINNYFAGRRAREANQFSHDERIAQNLWDLEQWNRQNAYDSPAAQMQRLKDAGLNPNLLYGDMTAATGQPLSHGAAPSGQMAQTFPFENPVASVLQARMMQSQIERTDAETASIKQETSLNYELTETQKFSLDNILPKQDKKLTADIKAVWQSVDESRARVDDLVAQFRLHSNQADIARVEALIKQDTRKAITDDLRNKARISEAEADAAVSYWTKLLLGLDADRALAESTKNLNDEQKAVVKASATIAGYTTKSFEDPEVQEAFKNQLIKHYKNMPASEVAAIVSSYASAFKSTADGVTDVIATITTRGASTTMKGAVKQLSKKRKKRK